jgi:hypothetical protein
VFYVWGRNKNLRVPSGRNNIHDSPKEKESV